MKKSDKIRYDYLRRIGCVACLLDGVYNDQIDIHHLAPGRKRIGNHATLPMCSWHHRGVPDIISAKETKARRGPSMALDKREFKERYGSEEGLLEFVNQLIEEMTNG